MPVVLREVREHLQQELIEKSFDNPSNTSLVLLSHLLNRPKSFVLAHGEYVLTTPETRSLEEMLEKISLGIPLPYILGEWAFFGQKFIVSPAVLIPRPETELLVEKALLIAKTRQDPVIVDVGTGSGAIIISLASQLQSGTFIGTDLSWEALKIAQQNAHKFSLSQIKLVRANLLTALLTQFDLICANLPYIPRKKLEGLAVAQSEPRLALNGGEDGLDLIEILITQAKTRLAPKGIVLLEIEASMGDDVLSIAKNAFPQAKCELWQDLTGHDRILEIQTS